MSYLENQNYGPLSPAHLYDLAIPEKVLLVLIHGGGFIGGDKQPKNFNYGGVVKSLSADYGICVASINYELAEPGKPTAPSSGTDPAVLNNIEVAIKHLKARTGCTRVVVLGTSAGATLACLAFQRYPELIDGFVGCYGIYDLKHTETLNHEVKIMVDTFTGKDPNRIEHGSPFNGTMPKRNFLLIHGMSDKVVHHAQSQYMHDKHGGEYIQLHGYGHAFNPFETTAKGRIMNYVRSGK